MDDAMRAKLPHTEGFLDRDGIKIHHEILRSRLTRTTAIAFHTGPVRSCIWRFYKRPSLLSDWFRVTAFDPRANEQSTPRCRATHTASMNLGDDTTAR